jgi:hypothetical protein
MFLCWPNSCVSGVHTDSCGSSGPYSDRLFGGLSAFTMCF